jgi:hypothetical protein
LPGRSRCPGCYAGGRRAVPWLRGLALAAPSLGARLAAWAVAACLLGGLAAWGRGAGRQVAGRQGRSLAGSSFGAAERRSPPGLSCCLLLRRAADAPRALGLLRRRQELARERGRRLDWTSRLGKEERGPTLRHGPEGDLGHKLARGPRKIDGYKKYFGPRLRPWPGWP